jgi:hypothetical protein
MNNRVDARADARRFAPKLFAAVDELGAEALRLRDENVAFREALEAIAQWTAEREANTETEQLVHIDYIARTVLAEAKDDSDA